MAQPPLVDVFPYHLTTVEKENLVQIMTKNNNDPFLGKQRGVPPIQEARIYPEEFLKIRVWSQNYRVESFDKQM